MSRGHSFLAKNIKMHREKLGITQEKLAVSSDVDYNVIIKIESGATANPTIDTVMKLARGLRITIDELMQVSKTVDMFRCRDCKKEYATAEAIWRCECGGLFDVVFESSFPISEIKKRKLTMWRYREAIPINNDKHIVSFNETVTPLIKVSIDNYEVYVKQDQLFSSGSYKDRGAAILVSKIKELGISRVLEDSLLQDVSGSASDAITAYCAYATIACDVLAPVSIAKEKLIQAQFFGSKLHRLTGSKSKMVKQALEMTRYNYYANHSWNPFFLHGTKTFAFEIWEQLGWKSPDVIIVPVGNGTLLLGVYIGFNELLQAGAVTKIPKIIGIQSANYAPLYSAYKKKLSIISQTKNKIGLAEGLEIENPIRGKEILDAIKNTGGDIITVNDSEIKQALMEMFRKGFYIEPTSAATIAGVKKYIAKDIKDQVIVSAFTGSGLRESEKIARLLIN